MIRSMCKAIDRLSDYMGYLGAFLVFLMALLLGYDVVMRFVFNDPTSWVLDISGLIQATMAFLMASYVMKAGGHVGMNLVTEFVGGRWRRYLAIATQVFSVAGCAWMGYLSVSVFTKSYNIREEAYGLNLPLYPFKLLVPVCFLLMGLQCLAMLIEAVLASAEDFAKLNGEGEEL